MSAAAVLPGSPAATAKKLVPSKESAPSPARSVARAAAPVQRAGNAALPAPFLLLQTAPAPLSLEVFAADCETPKSVWILGEAVCVKVDGVTSPSRILLVNPAGYGVFRAEIGFDVGPQTVSFTLPSDATLTSDDATFDNRGTWRVALVNALDASTRLSAPITVRDPVQTVANLQVIKALNSGLALAGGNVQSVVRVYNAGPDAAANVKFTDVPPANTTFLSLVQIAGPAFACTTPAANSTGPSVCEIASLGRDVPADFLITYKVNTSIANAADLTGSASVETTTIETAAADNGSADSATSSNPTPPACTMTCPDNVNVTAAPGQNGAVVTFDNPTLGGTCGAVTNSPASGSFFAIGSTAVTSTTADGQSCSFVVTVTAAPDTVAPSISCPSDITVNESSSAANSAAVTYSVTATDNSGTPVVECDPPSGSTFPVGPTQVRCTATDAAGNTSECTFNVTVNHSGCDLDANSADPVPNAATLPAITRACAVTLLPADDPTATDACGGAVSGDITHVNGQQSGDRTFEVPGTYTVTWSYTDGAGNTTTQNQTVTVQPDNSPPVPDAASLPTVTGECSAAITGAAPTAHDDCGGSDIAGTPLDPLSYNTPGTHVVRWKFTDPAGNSTIQNQTVVVTDGAAPVPDVASLPTLTGECSVTVTPPTATDNCAGAIIAVTPDPLTYTTQGTHTVHWTYTDAAGNVATQTQTVIVDDNTAPTINITGGGSTTVECSTGYTDAGATATDNCNGSIPVTTTSNNVNPNVPGTYHVNYSAQDAVGNTTTATRTVTVVDTIKPVITLNGSNPMAVILGSTFVDPGATAADGCAGTFAATPSGFVNTGAIGTYAVTYTASDPSGNAAVPVTRTVKVIYNFSGYFSPVANDPSFNEVKAGQSVPMKFSLSGNQGLNILAANSPVSAQVACPGTPPYNEISEVYTLTAGNSGLSYDSLTDQYKYVWKTENSWANTCRQFVLRLNDGTEHRANFKFKQ